MLKTKAGPKPIVNFCYADIASIPLNRKKEVKRFLIDMFYREGKALAHLDYIFCSDDYLLEINRTHLKHDYYTDIITFDLSESTPVIGEIYISVTRVKENAITHHTQTEQELLRVIFHGALHLCGYRDKKKSEITIMRQKEEEYLLLFQKK
jgi:probable rRNA maturation factor